MIKLSICIPTYNGALHLSETLEKVIARIDECGARETVEVVVCDNASTDATGEIVRTWIRRCPDLVRHVRNERNLGFDANFVVRHLVSMIGGTWIWPLKLWRRPPASTACRRKIRVC